MKILNLVLEENDKPIYSKIADAIRKSITDGNLLPGDRLLSSRQLAAQLEVNRNTVMNALSELVGEGWLVAAERSAYRVNDTLPDGFFRTARVNRAENFKAKRNWEISRQCDPMEAFYKTLAPRALFDSSTPDLRVFPVNEFKNYMVEALTFSPRKTLGYGQTQGHEPLISAFGTYLRRYRAVTDRKLVVTHGSQEAIFLCAQVLLRQGQRVAVPELSYPPAWEAFRTSGAKLVGIKSDAGGIDPESLASILKNQKIHMIYLTPLHQFPISKILSPHRRHHIYTLAAHHGIPIIEDDYDHEFHYQPQTPPPMASQDPAQIVIYVSTFSKILFPGVRIGLMAVPDALLEPLVRFRRVMNFQSMTLIQDAVARWMRTPSFEKHLYRMRRLYQERRDYTIQGLEEMRAAGQNLDFHKPEGGMALWLDTHGNSDDLADRAYKQGVSIHQESVFHLHNHPGTHIRLGFSTYSRKEIKEGLEQLQNLWSAPII